MNDEFFMKKAIELAYLGEGYTNPNPMVGAIIVKNNKIIGEGYHKLYGKEHAEINTFNNLIEDCAGATLYVTLEPCCFFGKTPPCVDEVVKRKIKKVVIGTLDPNPLVSGKSVEILKKNNIEVVFGVLEKECKELIKKFAYFITTKKPYITLKYAMTLDGKIATYSNKSKWISNQTALLHNRIERYQNMAIMVGVNTIINDDSQLTTRIKGKRDPIRIVCDTNLRTPIDAFVVKTAKETQTIIATSSTDESKKQLYKDKGCLVLDVDKKDGHLDLLDLVIKLGKLNIDSILFEGAKVLAAKFLEERLINYVKIYVCPKIFGGEKAVSPIGGVGVDSPDDAIIIKNQKITNIDGDILIEGEI